MNPIRFALVGGGWRSEFYLRIARACPERFEVTGLLVRDADKGASLEARFGAKTYRTVDELLRHAPAEFVVTSVSWTANPVIVVELIERGVPVLSETPPAPDLDGLVALWEQVRRHGGRVQVAEQYHLQPPSAARLAVAAGGRLGSVTQAQVSLCHGYHGLSMMRRFLGIGFDQVTVRGFSFRSPVVKGATRTGPPEAEVVGTAEQQLVQFDFGDKLGWFDFTGEQYFSYIRRNRLLVRGERGELTMDGALWLQDHVTPIEARFVRHTAGADGNLEGLYLKGIQLGDEWLYRNPFAPATLTDDEIAIASCLVKMSESLAGAPEFYPLAEGCQDHYLNLLAGQAIRSGEAVPSERQPWAG